LLDSKLYTMDIRLQETEKQSQWMKKLTQGDVDNLENLKMKNKIKELK
jgi:hypothetical protein